MHKFCLELDDEKTFFEDQFNQRANLEFLLADGSEDFFLFKRSSFSKSQIAATIIIACNYGNHLNVFSKIEQTTK